MSRYFRPESLQRVRDATRCHRDLLGTLVEARGATLRFLPPYSYDFNPIEAAWGLVKKRIRSDAPRTARALRRVAQAARHVVTPHHCQQWFTHAGYVNSSTIRD